MRIIFIVIFFFSIRPSEILGQRKPLLGKYVLSGLKVETIDFRERDSFYFRAFYCNYVVKGKGIFKVRRWSLSLYFDKVGLGLPGYFIKTPVITKCDTSGTFNVVTVTCLDNQDNKLNHVSVEIEESGRSTFGTSTNKDGRAVLVIPRRKEVVILKTQFSLTESPRIELDPGYNYNIIVYHNQLDSDNLEYNRGEVIEYQIKRITSKCIYMRPLGSEGHFDRYLRKERR